MVLNTIPYDDVSEIFISSLTCSSDYQIPIPIAFLDVPLEVLRQPVQTGVIIAPSASLPLSCLYHVHAVK